MMAVPGLALFYGGMVRSKNMLSVLMQVFVTFSLLIVLWVIYGYSVAFTQGTRSVHRRLRAACSCPASPQNYATAATFSEGVVIPEFVFVASRQRSRRSRPA